MNGCRDKGTEVTDVARRGSLGSVARLSQSQSEGLRYLKVKDDGKNGTCMVCFNWRLSGKKAEAK